jgi:hypothetical protein
VPLFEHSGQVALAEPVLPNMRSQEAPEGRQSGSAEGRRISVKLLGPSLPFRPVEFLHPPILIENLDECEDVVAIGESWPVALRGVPLSVGVPWALKY